MPKLPKLAKKSSKKNPPADPRYPIGPCVIPDPITQTDITEAIATIAEMPQALRSALSKLSNAKLDTPYREGGWTVRTLVHHLADSHMTAFHRFRKALTEDAPLVTDYEEQRLAELHDSAAPVEWSLCILEGLHARWVMLLQSMFPEQFQRTYNHATRGLHTLDRATLLYAWHAQHHTAHVTNLRAQKGW